MTRPPRRVLACDDELNRPRRALSVAATGEEEEEEEEEEAPLETRRAAKVIDAADDIGAMGAVLVIVPNRSVEDMRLLVSPDNTWASVWTTSTEDGDRCQHSKTFDQRNKPRPQRGRGKKFADLPRVFFFQTGA